MKDKMVEIQKRWSFNMVFIFASKLQSFFLVCKYYSNNCCGNPEAALFFSVCFSVLVIIGNSFQIDYAIYRFKDRDLAYQGSIWMVGIAEDLKWSISNS